MNKTILTAAVIAFCLATAAGQAKVLTNDPLTGLPLIPATVLFKNVGNEPDKMPDGQICKSKMQGNFYSLSTVLSGEQDQDQRRAAWYASHLSGFKKVQGYAIRPLPNRLLQRRRNRPDFLDRTMARRVRTQTRTPSPMNATSLAYPRKRSQA